MDMNEQTQSWKDYELAHYYVHDDPIKKWYIDANQNDPEFISTFLESWDCVMELVVLCVKDINMLIGVGDVESFAEEIGIKFFIAQYLLVGDIKNVYQTCVDFIKLQNKREDL